METSKNVGITPFVLGLLSVILGVAVGALPFIGFAVGVVGLVLSINARKTAQSGLLTAGFILSIIGVALTGIIMIFWLTCLGVATSVANSAIGFALPFLY